MDNKRSFRSVAVVGEFGIFTAGVLREQLLAALDDADEVEVDLARATDIDSAGVQLMIATKSEAVARGKTLRFVGHSETVVALLDLLDLTSYFGDPVLLPGNGEGKPS